MSPEKDRTIVSLSPQEMLRLEMIVTDRDKAEALAFVAELCRA